ncbi:hypothetical protein B0T12DRAFT_482892 [Alternaria alternata]|nr:hypothetical protein B0T12DRAFT_482892 [Alternaria alternata]
MLPPVDTSPIQNSFSGDSPLSQSQSAGGRERDAPPRTMARDRLPYDGGQTALLDEGSDGFGPSPSMPSYSEDSDRGEVIASDLGPMLLPSWSFQDAPNPPMTPGPLGPQEACLIRCFAQELATTFDTTDRTGHFATHLPMRALRNSLVLNAICGISAQYLLRMSTESSSPGMVKFQGTKLPHLTEESVMQYQSTCINLLIDASANPEEHADGDILSAITILRFHEQNDVLMTGSDFEVFQRAVQHNFETQFAQGRGLGQALPSLFTPLPIFQPNHLSANIAAYLVALRMEIWAVLLYQRPIRLPLPSFKDCRHVHDGEIDDDYLWTRRVLVWCAHVLKLHFGSDGFDVSDDGYASASELWGALKAFEFDWDTRPPSCFQPLYSRQNAPQQGRYFPELWLANPCQVMALQHIEFGRMMLANHEAQLQNRRLGGGELASQASEALFLHSMRTICGLAACHSDRHEALTAAAVAISMCGKYVRDAGERSALMSILHKLRTDFAWNISHAVNALNGGAGDATQGDLRT